MGEFEVPQQLACQKRPASIVIASKGVQFAAPFMREFSCKKLHIKPSAFFSGVSGRYMPTWARAGSPLELDGPGDI
jgi:hypothetical protein